jgi:hypothetical protein
MKCCGICGGFTKLHFQGTHFSVVPNTFGIVAGATPYGLFKHYYVYVHNH